MDTSGKTGPGENESLMRALAARGGGVLSFRRDGALVAGVFEGESASGMGFRAETLPKAAAEEACGALLEMLLMRPEMAAAAGAPPASSVEELRLRLAVEGDAP
jgi:hypothetical protein